MENFQPQAGILFSSQNGVMLKPIAREPFKRVKCCHGDGELLCLTNSKRRIVEPAFSERPISPANKGIFTSGKNRSGGREGSHLPSAK